MQQMEIVAGGKLTFKDKWYKNREKTCGMTTNKPKRKVVKTGFSYEMKNVGQRCSCNHNLAH